jgi:hypothetical protein
MPNKLFYVRSVEGVDFGMVPPQNPKADLSDHFVDFVASGFLLENAENQEKPVEIARLYLFGNLVPASPSETLVYYRSLDKKDLAQLHCYWFFIQAEGYDGSVPVKVGHLPVYHFGIECFFSGRVDFDWSRNGGTVYKVQ